MQNIRKMTISELSGRSSVPISTIKYYIRERLLPKPIKTSETRGHYTPKHLDRLKLIKKIQREGMSLNQIREIIDMVDANAVNEPTNQRVSGKSTAKPDIINASITLFREKGFDAVTIADITEAADIGCSTFYKNFKNKKELFLKCIQKIIADETSLAYPEKVNTERDLMELFYRDTELSYQQAPLWQEMINILRAAAVNNPAEFADTLDEALQLKINLFKDRIEKGMNLGYLRKVDQTLFAVMVLGLQEACYDYFSKKNYTESQRRFLIDGVMDILMHGVMKK